MKASENWLRIALGQVHPVSSVTQVQEARIMILAVVLGKSLIVPDPREIPDSPLRMAEKKETKGKNTKEKSALVATGKRVIPHDRS